MKSKKAQVGIGVMVIMAIAVIVGLVLFQQAAGDVGDITTTQSLSQGLYSLPASGSCTDLVGQELIGTATVTNRSTGTTIGNVTVSERVSTVDGLKRIGVCATGANWEGDPISARPVNITYTYGPEGYVADSGARSVTTLITLLAAIAIALVVLGGIKFDW